jgi:glycosyltransferase involved in cell wall biosynthesis
MPDVVLPVLDEIQALPWVLSRMPSHYRAIVVDNGSTDGSAECALKLGAHVIVEPTRGFGAACWAGLQAASENVVCFMDCDGSLDPQDLPQVVGPLTDGSADLVLGRRRAAPGAWPLHARVANRALAFELRRRVGLSLRDLGPMRAAHRHDLLKLNLTDRRSGWPLEMVLSAHRAGMDIREVDIPYLRRAGRSKVTGTVRGSARAMRDMGALLRRATPELSQ